MAWEAEQVAEVAAARAQDVPVPALVLVVPALVLVVDDELIL